MQDDTQLHFELAESRRVIEQKIGRPAPVLAYPVGVHHAFDERVVTAARGCGHRSGVSYLSGANRVSAREPFAIKRLHVERYTGRGDFETMLTLPEPFGL